jgi:hypothetical protein
MEPHATETSERDFHIYRGRAYIGFAESIQFILKRFVIEDCSMRLINAVSMRMDEDLWYP